MIYTQITDDKPGEKDKNAENIKKLICDFYLKSLVPMLKPGKFTVWCTQWRSDDLYETFKEVNDGMGTLETSDNC